MNVEMMIADLQAEQQKHYQAYYLRSSGIAEPYIPTEMEDWDKEFWLATGIVVPGTTCRDLI